MSLGRLFSNSLISNAKTTSRNLTSAPRGCKIVWKRFFFSTTARRVTSPTWGPHLHENAPLLSWFFPSAIAETKAYDEVFSLSPPWRVSDRFFERSGKRFTQESPKIRSWRWCAVFYWSEKWSAWKMGSQPRRAAANTESLSLWQTCWSLRPWQDERKGLYLIQWCFSWTLKLWLQSSWSLLTVMFLFFLQVTSRYYWVRLLEDWNCQALRCLPAYF